MTPTTVDCYFDYVSPFSYLLHEQLYRLPPDTTVNYIPVLFAGLLKHWGNLGPVEIERKKTFTYRHATWLAKELNVPFRVPDTHPFIPLPFLRVTIAMSNDPALISSIYRAIWTADNNPATEEGRKSIWKYVGIENADAIASDPQIKQKLIDNTQQATQAGIFGVPTMTVGQELFWGLDSIDLLIDYLRNAALFDSEEMKRLDRI